MPSKFMLRYRITKMNARKIIVITHHVSVGRIVYRKTMHHLSLDVIEHYLDFKGRFPYMIEKNTI